MRRLKQFRAALVGLVAVGALSIGAWSAWPETREAVQLCTLDPPCGDDCDEKCRMANYENGGDCNELEDCCVCFER